MKLQKQLVLILKSVTSHGQINLHMPASRASHQQIILPQAHSFVCSLAHTFGASNWWRSQHDFEAEIHSMHEAQQRHI